jgi:hypothetical protein
VVKIHSMVWVRTSSSLVDGYQYFRQTYFLTAGSLFLQNSTHLSDEMGEAGEE